MAMTITEKILARASGKTSVKPGDYVWANVDVLMTHDICGPGTIGKFHQEFGKDAKVWDKDKVVIIPDHYIFTKDQKAHRNVDILRAFVKEQNIRYFYDPGTPSYKGVCHVALPQEGHVRPGTVLLGTDSHTCTAGGLGAFATGIGNTEAAFVMGAGKLLLKIPPTLRFTMRGKKPDYISAKDIILRIIGDIGVDGANYMAMEFRGEGIASLDNEERMSICNMAIEAGGKNGLMEPDERTFEYVRKRTAEPFEPVYGDTNAPVKKHYEYDLSTFVPCVAKPSLPSNYAPAADCKDVKPDRVYIGSCTGGKITDFKMAAQLLKGHKVKLDVFLVPATQEVFDDIMKESIDGKPLVEIFAEAGCKPLSPPSCAACLGGPEDTYGRANGKEVVVSTTNRNFIGRMGSKQALIYLASPYVAAATAIAGRIADPREFM